MIDSILKSILKDKNHIPNVDKLPVWVIGDVHGCSITFSRLLREIKSRGENCLIFQLGDLIDRGPDLLRVFELMDMYDVHGIIGNHEYNFLQEYFGYKPCRSKERRKTHDKLKELSDEDKNYIITKMLSLKNYFTVTVGDNLWTLSHAPFKGNPIDFNGGSYYCMQNNAYPVDDPSTKYKVHGHMHWNYRHISEQINNPTYGGLNVDAGAVYGEHLLAVELTNLDYIEVKSNFKH